MSTNIIDRRKGKIPLTEPEPEPLTEPEPLKEKIKLLLKPQLETNYPKAVENIELKSYQTGHVDALIEILKKYPVACDFSALGSGKSFTSSYISLNSPFNFKHVIVIGPVSIADDWGKKKTVYGVPLHSFVSYNSLRSVKGKFVLSNGLLNRYDSTREMNIKGKIIKVDVVDFDCTTLYKRMVSEGLLLIIDEIQSIKNITAQFKACQQLVHEIVGSCNYVSGTTDGVPRNNSRVLLLSGTPFDKEKQLPHFYRLISMMKHDELSQYNIQTCSNTWTGFGDICKISKSIDIKTTKQIVIYPDNSVANAKIIPMCYQLFQKVIKQIISHSMYSVQIEFKTAKANAFYSILEDDDRKLLSEGVDTLKSTVCFNTNTNGIEISGSGTLAKIQRALMMIETAKINTFYRIGVEFLDSDPNLKLIICVNYVDTIADLNKMFEQYNPVILQGSVTPKRRAEIIEQFQIHDNNCRLIIANSQVASVGINLDDQHGKFPRVCLVSPNYSTISLAQVSDRFRRSLTKSDSIVYFLFGKHACELKVLQALAKKSAVMKETIIDDVQVSHTVFPCDYPYMIEDTEEKLSNDIVLYMKRGKLLEDYEKTML